MKLGLGLVVGAKSRDLDKLLNPEFCASLEKRSRSGHVNGFQTVGAVALKDASRVDDRVDPLEALPPVFHAISGEIARDRFPGRKHEAKLRRVPSAGDDLMSAPGGLDGDMPSYEAAGADDQNPHGVTPLHQVFCPHGV
jgi:hypothetical protein